jgi:hypothetical protein
VHKWQVNYSNAVIERLITFLCCDACINIGRDVILSTREIHLFLTTVLRCRRLPHPVADVPSVPGEQAPKPTSPRVPAWGRERIRFLGSAITTARWMSSSLYARCSPISIADLLLSLRRQPHCKDVYSLFVVRSCLLSVTSTRWRDFVSDHSASVESHIYVSCCWSFPDCQN